MELKEANNKLIDFSKINFLYGKLSFTKEQLRELQETVSVILKELDKKDKVIDEMANTIYEELGFSSSKNVKQYFYKKVEEQE